MGELANVVEMLLSRLGRDRREWNERGSTGAGDGADERDCEQAEGRFGTSPLGQTMSQQHRRVYGIMARSLDNVATDLGQFASGIDAAAKSVTTTDDDIGGELLLRALTLQASNTDLNDYDPHLGHGGKHHGGESYGG